MSAYGAGLTIACMQRHYSTTIKLVTVDPLAPVTVRSEPNSRTPTLTWTRTQAAQELAPQVRLGSHLGLTKCAPS